MEIIALIILVIIFSSVFKFSSPAAKGRVGEHRVNSIARRRLDSEAYDLIYDVTIPNGRGSTTQIDHIILSVYGIFVIETKNYSGWIFGSQKSAQWTQVVYKEKNRFMNPLRQNYGHISALSSLLGIPKSKFHNIVCFTGSAEFKTPIPENVFFGREYVDHVLSFGYPVFTSDELDEMRGSILSGTPRQRRVVKEYKQSIPTMKKNYASTSASHERTSKICDRCGSPMVLRTARKGKNTGNQFLGCSEFPQCRYTVNI